MEMKLFNTLGRKQEVFKPINKHEVGIYSCGPTVYWNQHIGNMYAYVEWDLLNRTLKYLGYKTTWVMNITDVGHLTSDEDTGEDKLEKGAKSEGLSVWKIADKYIAQFKESMKLLNIKEPDELPRATDHIAEQIKMIDEMEKRGFTYKTKTGIVFDTSKFPDYAKFANLNLEEQKAGSRVEVDEEKKNPWDFLLWITNQPNHVMQWDSPWGKGFPGWHIECTAMSTKYLGNKFDIHTGGKEHIPVHHTNEIAQAYGAFGEQTANYWLHNEWVTFGGDKIAKSAGSAILITDLEEKGFSPLSYRYLIMTSHYRTGLNFTWESLESAQIALSRLKNSIKKLQEASTADIESNLKEDINWDEKFKNAIADDLGTPQAIAILWDMLKGDLSAKEKIGLVAKWDKVFGLDLLEIKKEEIPAEVSELAKERANARKEKSWQKSDELRDKISGLGYEVLDTENGFEIRKK